MSELMQGLQLLINFTGLIVLGGFLLWLIKRSALGVFISIYFSWYLIGLYIYPIFLTLGIIKGQMIDLYPNYNNSYAMIAAVHCLLLSFGIVMGYITNRTNFIFRYLKGVAINLPQSFEQAVFPKLVLGGILIYLLYFYLVGFDVALANAAAARGGIFDSFGDKVHFLFLKTLGSSTILFGAIFLYFLSSKKIVSAFLYICLILLIYVNSISRNMFLVTTIVPLSTYLFLTYRRMSNKLSGFILFSTGLVLLFGFSIIVVRYGKIFGYYQSTLFSSMGRESYSLISAGNSKQVFSFIENYGFMWASIQKGIETFFMRGPYLSSEYLLSVFFGWIPSHWLSMVGLQDLYYGNLPENFKIACYNSHNLGLNNCTVPPSTAGYLAYMFPIGGALILGWLTGFWIRAMESLWIYLVKININRIWFPAFMCVLYLNIITFIPTLVASTVFTMFLLIFLIIICKWIIPRTKLSSFSQKQIIVN